MVLSHGGPKDAPLGRDTAGKEEEEEGSWCCHTEALRMRP